MSRSSPNSGIAENKPSKLPNAFGGKTREDAVENNSDLAGIVGENLHRLRTQKNLSLEALSKLAGVSRAMLGQIELGKSTPTIRILSRVAAAFGVPFSAFLAEQQHSGTVVLRRQESKVLKSEDGTFASRTYSHGMARGTSSFTS